MTIDLLLVIYTANVLTPKHTSVFTVVKIQNKPKLQNTSPTFGYMVQKCLTKVWRLEKKILYDVLFCKSRLSKMASTKTNKIEKRTPLPKTNF